MIWNFITEVKDFLVPRFCTVCECHLNPDQKFICQNCESSLVLLDETQISAEFNRKFSNKSLIDDYTSAYVFENDGNFQKLVHALKYDKKFKIGNLIGQKLGEIRKGKIESWKADLIIPVPLFNLKKIERGFNQVLYIAKGLKKSTNLPINSKIIKRTRNTISQTTLTLNEREENVRGAFRLKKIEVVKSKRIIILDDVITTGATVLEIARLLKDNHAEKVFALSTATPPISHPIRSTHA